MHSSLIVRLLPLVPLLSLSCQSASVGEGSHCADGIAPIQEAVSPLTEKVGIEDAASGPQPAEEAHPSFSSAQLAFSPDSLLASQFPWVKDVSSNNSLVFFKNGQEKFDDLFRAVRQARSTIHMEYFNFRDDSIANALFDLLAIKAKQGVKVRLLFDAFGNDSNNKPLRRKKLQELRRRGLEIYVYDPLDFPWLTHVFSRDHRKIVVIDGQTAYSGGMNIADYYIKGKAEFGQWRDIHFRIEGDAVASYQKIFLRIWNRTTGQHVHGADLYPGMSLPEKALQGLKQDTTSTRGHKTIAVVNREPCLTPDVIRRTFVSAISHAQRLIQIINPYFTLRRPVRRALQEAIKRGVRVEIIVSDKSDIPITPQVVDYNVRRLQRRGAHVYYFQGGFHHSKIMMIDSLYCFAGSANLDSRSLYFDYEVNALILDPPSTHALQSIFESDKLHRCRPLTDDYWRQRSKGKRFSQWLYHFLEPWI